MKSKGLRAIILIFIYSIIASLIFTACDFLELEVSSPEANSSAEQNSSNNSNSMVSIESSVVESQEVSDEQSIGESSQEESVVSEPEESKVVPTPTQQDTDLHGLSVEECNDYFDGSLFFGDSVMMGFEARVKDQKNTNPEYFGDVNFFAVKNLGYRTSLMEIKEGRTTYHPQYLGEQTYIWDIVAEIKPPRIFILFGLNDLAGVDSEKYTFSSMKKLVEKIEDSAPDVEIVILSTTYYTRNGENPAQNRYNEVNRNFNEMLLQYCNENGMDFIDVANCLTDEEGYLIEDYSSDDYVHLKYFSYDHWVEVLRGYAADKILNQYKNVETMLRN